MATVTTPAGQAPEPESAGAFGRILGVYFSPKETFESIARRPTWLLPLVLVLLVSLGVVIAFGQRGGWSSYLRKQVESSSSFQQMPPDQQQRVLEQQLKYAPRVVPFEAIVAVFLAAIIIAALLLGTFNLLFGSQITFKTSLAVVTHSFLPGLVSGLIGILVVFLKDPTTIDIQNVVASNLGAFLPSEAPRWQVALLGSLDVFSFWEMTLLAMGYRAAAAPKKLSFATAFFSIVGLWLVYVLAKTGLTAAFS